MRPLLAHQGGWDEMLLAAALVLLMLGVSRWRRRGTAGRPARGVEIAAPEPPDPDACSYCGDALEPEAERCPSCGFRVRRSTRS
jgi:hypothetical protein